MLNATNNKPQYKYCPRSYNDQLTRHHSKNRPRDHDRPISWTCAAVISMRAMVWARSCIQSANHGRCSHKWSVVNHVCPMTCAVAGRDHATHTLGNGASLEVWTPSFNWAGKWESAWIFNVTDIFCMKQVWSYQDLTYCQTTRYNYLSPFDHVTPTPMDW